MAKAIWESAESTSFAVVIIGGFASGGEQRTATLRIMPYQSAAQTQVEAFIKNAKNKKNQRTLIFIRRILSLIWS
jgi:hypothetical protein